jgi:two-component sensor histidine kinase
METNGHQQNHLRGEVKRLRKLLAECANEKEILLAELQHQVRNNLQAVVSMINLHRQRQAVDMDIIRSRVEATLNAFMAETDRKKTSNDSG